MSFRVSTCACVRPATSSMVKLDGASRREESAFYEKNGEQSRNQAIKKSCSHPELHALLISWLLKRAGTEHDCVSSLLEALELWG